MFLRLCVLIAILALPMTASGQQYWQYGGGVFGGAPGAPMPCPTIPGTSTQVGASCFPQNQFPSLTNPQDPATIGPDVTGDYTSAINTIFSNGNDVYFKTPGTYKINNCADCTGNGLAAGGHTWCTANATTNGGSQACSSLTNVSGNGNSMVPPANRKVACVAGVTITTSIDNYNHDFGIFWLQNSGNVIAGCTFQGTATTNPAEFGPNISKVGSDYAIAVSGATSPTIEGNTFQKFIANAAIETVPEAGTTSSLMIQYNTFQGNANYSAVIASTANSTTMQNNLSYDNIMGAEYDGCAQGGTIGTGSVIKNNEVMYDVGNCVQASPNCVTSGGNNRSFEGEAYASPSTSCNYSGLTIGPGNYCAAMGPTVTQTYINGGLGGTNTGTGNQTTFPGTDIPAASCKCQNGGGTIGVLGTGQTCP